jgi:cysteine desulfurase/selenocysteine lyase
VIYLDYAATSWPKPPEVISAMTSFLERAGGNAGRSGHRLSVAAGRVVYDCREAVAVLFNVSDPLRVAFTMNATHALNIGLHGLLRRGDHVVTTGIEHNAVMRPLRAFERKGVRVSVVPCGRDGSLRPDDFAAAITPGTRLAVVNHASNVTGTILPVAEFARAAHAAGAYVMVDAAQTAGVVPIAMEAMGIDLLAFSGHKGLLGPPGTGGLVIGPGIDSSLIEPLMRGGTGSRSEHEEQPEDLPDKLECGTANGVGIAGLGAGVRLLLRRGVATVREQEVALTRILVDGLGNIPGVTTYGPVDPNDRIAVVSFTARHQRVSETGLRLDEEHGILCRVGLHCAPAAHRTIGTFPDGTVRLAPGMFTKHSEVLTALKAVERVLRA